MASAHRSTPRLANCRSVPRLALAGEGGERQQDDEQRHQHLQADRCGQLAETTRGGRVLDGAVSRELLLMRFEKRRHADVRIESGIDGGQRFDRLEDEGAEVRGRVRVHLAFVQRDFTLGALGFCVQAFGGPGGRPAREEGRGEDGEEQRGGPAKAAVAPEIDRVPGPDGQAIMHRGRRFTASGSSWSSRRRSRRAPWP